MVIRPMRSAEIDFAVASTQREGWLGESREVFEGFFAHDGARGFIAEADGEPIGLCVVRGAEGGLQGFLFGRRSPQGVHAGPWIQDPRAGDPGALPAAIAGAAGGSDLLIGVLEANAAALRAAALLGLEERSDPPWRMTLGDWSPGDDGLWQFGIGSPAKG